MPRPELPAAALGSVKCQPSTPRLQITAGRAALSAPLNPIHGEIIPNPAACHGGTAPAAPCPLGRMQSLVFLGTGVKVWGGKPLGLLPNPATQVRGKVAARWPNGWSSPAPKLQHPEPIPQPNQSGAVPSNPSRLSQRCWDSRAPAPGPSPGPCRSWWCSEGSTVHTKGHQISVPAFPTVQPVHNAPQPRGGSQGTKKKKKRLQAMAELLRTPKDAGRGVDTLILPLFLAKEASCLPAAGFKLITFPSEQGGIKGAWLAGEPGSVFQSPPKR